MSDWNANKVPNEYFCLVQNAGCIRYHVILYSVFSRFFFFLLFFYSFVTCSMDWFSSVGFGSILFSVQFELIRFQTDARYAINKTRFYLRRDCDWFVWVAFYLKWKDLTSKLDVHDFDGFANKFDACQRDSRKWLKIIHNRTIDEYNNINTVLRRLFNILSLHIPFYLSDDNVNWIEWEANLILFVSQIPAIYRFTNWIRNCTGYIYAVAERAWYSTLEVLNRFGEMLKRSKKVRLSIFDMNGMRTTSYQLH